MYKMGRLITDRDREIYKLRTSQRWSFEKIGEKYGISSGRAKELYRRAERMIKNAAAKGFPDDTPVRIYNALGRSGIKSFDELRSLSKLDLYEIHGLGRYSIEWLLSRLEETKESTKHMTLLEAKEYVKTHFPYMKTFEEDGYCALIRLRHKAEALPEMDCCGNIRDDCEWAYYDGVGKTGTGSYGEFYYFGKRGTQ